MTARRARADLVLIAALTAGLWIMHARWFALDTTPPAWDMAVHQTYALNYLPAADRTSLHYWELSGNYPPFVHLAIAAVESVFHPSPRIAVLVNIPATFLLLWGVYTLGLVLSGLMAARWASALTLLTPFLIWISRETLLDYWLAAWVAVALATLLRSEGFESRTWSLLFGLTCALGLLTKWFFPVFVLGPAAWIIVRHRIWRSNDRMLNCAFSALLATAIASAWYVPNLARLYVYFFDNAQIGAREGEPPVLSLQSVIYYLRVLEGYQLFALLFFLLIGALIFASTKRGAAQFSDRMFLVTSIAGGWLALTALRTKDPRFTMPFLAPMMVFVGAWIQSWSGARAAQVLRMSILLLLGFQAYLANFGVSWLPERVVLAEGYQGQLRWDWNLYLQNYFHISGPPRNEDWKQDAILDRMSRESAEMGAEIALAMVPDLPRFNPSNFELFARLRRLRMRVAHLQSAEKGTRAFDGFNHVILIEGDQGWAYTTKENVALNRLILDSPDFRLLDAFSLPNGDTALLYANRGTAP